MRKQEDGRGTQKGKYGPSQMKVTRSLLKQIPNKLDKMINYFIIKVMTNLKNKDAEYQEFLRY